MKLWKKVIASVISAAMLCSAAAVPVSMVQAASDSVEASYNWGTLRIGGGGFVSGIVTGQKAMYARTDVGGAYKYNYETDSWDQLFGFLNDAERGYLSVDAMAIDPTDDDTVYFLCGCAYFTDAKTMIFKTTDGGKTFTRVDVTDLIQVHGNGNGRQTGESIAVDPDNPDTIYCGGDVTAGESCLIKSTDGGKTWNPVKSYDDLGLYTESIKWPMWTNHMTKALTNGEYNTQNGVSTIYIYDGKVYVGTSTTGKNSVVVADVKDDKFTDISGDLDSANYPGRITGDGRGNIFFAFQGAVCVGEGGTSGSVMKLDTKTGKITDISPLRNLYRTQTGEFAAPSEGGYSGISVDPNNPDHMVCSTCGLFSNAQLWQPWDDEHGPSWGDKFFKSEDGGEHWIETTPGLTPFWGQPPIADYLADAGYAWIRDKAIHWVGAYVIDPVKPDRSISTSGNGMFACDNTWDELPQFHFHPDGIEEVVSLDMVSVPGGPVYSAIGDYDGFIHVDPNEIPAQYVPNIGSTSAIAYCPSDTNVLARVSENVATGLYSLDGGKTWEDLNVPGSSGKLAITQLKDGSYRFFKAGKDNAALSYTDDFGATWESASGLKGTSTSYTLVDLNDPSRVYAYSYNYNSYWASNPALTEPSFEEAHYSVFFSSDYGATFTETELTRYDMCDHAGDLAYIGEDTVAAAAGWYGLYILTDNCTKAEKTDVFYCKTVGYGAPEKAGGPNTLFMYGKPSEDDAEGLYRSTDMGKTWVCINTLHLYGGTGNGNYVVGDMNTFGKMYMSTVGCGIVYGEIAGSTPTPPPTTQPTTKPTESTTPDTTDIVYGDTDENGTVNLVDVVLLNKHLMVGTNITKQGILNADVDKDGTLSAIDSLNILKFCVDLVTLPVE